MLMPANNKQTASDALTLGTVIAANNGKAQQVISTDNHCYPVTFASHAIPTVSIGMQVVFYIKDEQALLLHIIEPVAQHLPKYSFQQIDNNRLKLTFGCSKIEIHSAGRISLQVGSQHITLDEQGALLCQADAITLSAKHEMTLACLENDIQFETGAEPVV